MITFVGTKNQPERYDIGNPVGAGGQNVSTEVMLVQYFLRRFGARTVNPVQPRRPASILHILKVDGIVGPKTIEAIHAYQAFNDIQPDRRVDPHGKTIRLLNFDFRNHHKDLDFNTPALWPDMPFDLAVAMDQAVKGSEPRQPRQRLHALR